MSRRRRRSNLLAIALALPFLVAACVTVDDEGGAEATPTPDPQPAASAASATPTPRPTPEPTPEPIDLAVFGFMPYWLVDSAAMAIDPDLLSTVTWHGIEASGNGRLVSEKANGTVPGGWSGLESDAFAELKDRLQAAGVEMAVTIQRFGWTEGTMERTRNLLTDRRDRRRLADRIAAFVEERGFDGVNLDFEPMPEDLADEYVEFVREVRAALDAVSPGQHLSVDVHSSLTGYDLAGLTADDAADIAILMAYEYRGEGAGVAASISPLTDPASEDISSTVEAALAQVGADKLVLGLPWYGRAWSTEAPSARSATRNGRDVEAPTTVSYDLAVEQAELFGRRYQPRAGVGLDGLPLEELCLLRERLATGLVRRPRQLRRQDRLPPSSRGLNGVGTWALGHEGGRDELWWTLRNRIQQRADDAPPNGNAALEPGATRRERDGMPVVTGSVPLRLIAADAEDGTGLGYVRIGLTSDLDGRGRLVDARTYPASDRIVFPLGDPDTGGAAESGLRAVHVQWRDLAGNWSEPIVIDVWAEDPEPAPSI